MDRKMKKEGGFTLVELMVVVSIAVLLLAWGLPSYSSWKKKHDVENQMVQLYSDIQFGRMTAYSGKVVSGVWWGGNTPFASYQIRSDANNNGTIDDTGVDTQIGATVSPKYAITSSAAQNSVSFDGRGFWSPSGPNPITFSVAPSFGAAVDCVTVSSTRVTLGKMTAGSCAPK
jgi:prepilin-type N-terminal cleavage/methylation domain-containing protein